MTNLVISWQLSLVPTDSYVVKVTLNGLSNTEYSIPAGTSTMPLSLSAGDQVSVQIKAVSAGGVSSAYSAPEVFAATVPTVPSGLTITQV